MLKLEDLCAAYPNFGVAGPGDNEEILAFLGRVQMRTERGALSARREPDFFALGRAQGERSFTILMRNDDGSIGGIAALSVTRMTVKGKAAQLVYASDLRLADDISRATRLRFHRWYEELALRCAEIEEFGGSPFMVTSVFDENTAAVRALVQKKKGKREPVYRPIFPYQNINVLGRWPGWRSKRAGAVGLLGHGHEAELKDFLCANPEGSAIVWSGEELDRRLAALGLEYGDFLVVRRRGRICAAALPYSDADFRRLVLKDIGAGVKWVGRLLPLMGKPGFRAGTALRTGFLGFLKVVGENSRDRAELVAVLLGEALRTQRKLPRAQRFHTLTVMDAQANRLERALKRRGFLFTRLPATLYQVVHRKNYRRENLLPAQPRRRPDFDVGLA